MSEGREVGDCGTCMRNVVYQHTLGLNPLKIREQTQTEFG